ncbi:MAG: 3-phosphoshikimate 1-carboxyvinyltransferase [Gemmatimonadaceae bacterium]
MKVHGSVRMPGDKSISHRALILSSLAAGESLIRGVLDSEDVASTARVLRALGVDIPPLADVVRIVGVGLRGLRPPRTSLDCGNSGTTTRLVAGMVAAHPFSARFEGDESLSRRPMKRIAEPLTYMGARVDFEKGDGLPMTVRGVDLRSIDWDTGGSSAQVKSAVLLAGVIAGVEVRVTEKIRSRDHTERMLRAMGVDVENDRNQVCLRPSRRLEAVEFEVPGDPSSAAMFVALAAMADEGELVLEDVCLNPTRAGFLAAVIRMGGDVSREGVREISGEQIGSLRVRPAPLDSISIGEAEIPAMIDEVPILACLAAGSGVDLEITGAAELRAKESDRIAAVVENLLRIGADAEELPDGLRVHGGKKALAGTIDPRGDHRLAMAFGVLGAVRGNRVEIRDAKSVAVSYPGFWSDLKRAVA